MMLAKYTRRPDDSGWLSVMLSAGNRRIAVCEYTKVEIKGERDSRVLFRIVDGNSGYAGKEASLKVESAHRYLMNEGPLSTATVSVQYLGMPSEEDSPFKGPLRQQWAEFSFNGNKAKVTLNSIWNERYTPIPPGTHIIMAPDSSHGNISTAGYRQAIPGLRCTDVWFPIRLSGTHSNSGRYIHAGHLSEGCITVHELEKWNAVYDYLIRSRLPNSNGRFVGTLVVRST
jgi:hypothetical protein